MADITTIKGNIDTNITNKTATNSITPSIVGTQLKAVVDELPPYKIYAANLNQTGTDHPVATVFQNTLGGLPVWTRDSIGKYTATLASTFPTGKVAIMISQGANQSSINNLLAAGRINDNSIFLWTGQLDDLMVNVFIEIRIYP